MSAPTVSVVVPVRDRADLLREAIVSCLVQTHPNVELVVVDDGSAEPLGPLVDELASRHGAGDRVRCVRQERHGANAARNRGLRESTGELLQFLDSDDLLHPEKLAVQAAVLEECPDVDMVLCLDEYFARRPGDTGVLWNAPGAGHDLDRFLADDPVWHTGSPLWRREALDRVGPWDERLACWQDWELHVRALCRGVRSAHVARVLQYVRDHGEPRSTDVDPHRVRAESRLVAASSARREVREAGMWSRRRGDALAWFLLSIAVDLARAGADEKAREAIRQARRCAHGARARAVAAAMQAAARGERHGRRTLLGGVRRLAVRTRFWRRPPATWKTLPSPSVGPPSTLIRALDEVHAPVVAGAA